MTNTIAEMERAEAFLIIGSNTTVAHPVLATYVKRAVRHHGAKLVVIDPRGIGMVDHATLWLRQRPGTDIAVINGIMHVILRDGLADENFITERCEEFDAFKEVLAEYPPDEVEKISGVPADGLVQAAHIFGEASCAMILYAMGITQHTHGTDNVKSLANLALMTGNIGRESTGVNPLRGQNNVQGACDMGGLPNVYPGYQKVDLPEVQQKMETAWGVKLSGKVGMPVTKIMPAAIEGGIKAIYVMGENPIVSDPDTAHVIKALENLEFFVVQDIFLTETAQYADVVLPAACFAEKDGSFTNSERRVQRCRKAVPPPAGVPEDWRTLMAIANRMGLDWAYESAEEIMVEIASVTPSYGGITYERIEAEGGLQWPCPDEEHPGTQFLHKGVFPRGKGLFHAIRHQEPAEKPDDAFPFTLTTGRVLYQYHSRTMTGRAKGVNDLAPECEIEINPADAENFGLTDGQHARIASRRGQVEAKVHLTERVERGVLFMPFHYADAAANVLTNPALDPVSKIPEFKVCAASIEPV
jgi:formate dehydrogenase alpha subunit